jgi:splicing factor 3B subunit 3
VGLGAKLTPRTCTLGFIKTYRFKDGGQKLELVHQTPCENIPGAFAELKGRLLAGVGPILRVYDLGQKKLLRKHENKNFASPITNIRTEQNRIYASDISESIHVLKYKPDENQLYIFADDVLKRYTNQFCLLDEDTVAAVDKFENFFVVRVPAGIEEDAEDDPTSSRFKWENGMLNGAQSKLEQISQYFIGEVSTALQKVTTTKGVELIYCATTMGGICAFVPFETKEDLDFFTHLEMFLRIEAQPLAGRDHVMFRSSYAPVKDVIDGDLCEMFTTLDFSKQRVMAEELSRNPAEVSKKLEQSRSKIL